MSNVQNLDENINKATFWMAVVLLVSAVFSVFFPLDAPAAAFPDRMIWFSKNLNAFVAGWVVQMIAMLTLSGVFAGIAWQTRGSHPLSAFLAGTAVLVATIAFLVPKFIAIWSIPQMVVASTTVTPNVAVAEQLFQLLNPSLSFSLFTSFDYLGFWMYGIFALLVARPLFQLTLTARIAAVALGLYGILYHLLMAGVMTGSVTTADIGAYSGSIAALLLIPVVSMAIYFRQAMKAKAGP